jgi:hypothetical protein
LFINDDVKETASSKGAFLGGNGNDDDNEINSIKTGSYFGGN